MKPLLAAALLVSTLISTGVITSCKRAAPKPDLIILHTGRISGNVYPVGFRGAVPLQHYSFLSTYVKRVRQSAANDGVPVLLMDLGDSLGGSFASHVTGNQNMVTFFNHLGYDIVALGNLDNDIPPGVIAQLDATVLTPFINEDGESPMPGTSSAALIEKGGINISVLSNFHGDLALEDNPLRFPAWFGTSSGNILPVREYDLSSLDSAGEPSLRLFSWMKFESPSEQPGDFLQQLVEMDVDVAVAHRIYSGSLKDVWTGDNFYDWTPPVSENILRRNEGFTIARLELKRTGDSWKVLKHELVTLTSNTAPPDTVLEQELSKFVEPLQAADAEIAELDQDWNAQQIFDTYCVALSKVPGTEAVLYSPQSIRSEWAQGKLLASQVFNSLPWTSGLIQVRLSSEEIDSLKSLSGIQFTRLESATNGATVTTSRYFAAILARELKLDQDRFSPTDASSEFDFFTSYLQNQETVQHETLGEEWVTEVEG